MKLAYTFVTVALAAACQLNSAGAQPSAGAQLLMRQPPTPDYGATQKILDAHAGSRPPTARVAENLHARGLAPTSANIATVRRWLAASSDSATRVALVRLLGSLFRFDDPAKYNSGIARDVKAQVYGGDRSVALAAIQTYARLGFQPDTIDILEFGLAQKLIGDDDFSQELALGLPLVPRHLQADYARRLEEKNSAFGAEVLALTLSGDWIGKLSPEAATILTRYLRKREPVLSSAIGEFGLNAGGRYAEWLHLTALLEEATAVSSYDAAIWSRLNDERTDPRKILGFLTAPEGAAFMRKQGRRSAFSRPAQRALGVAGQFPNHPVFAPLAKSLEASLGTLSQ